KDVGRVVWTRGQQRVPLSRLLRDDSVRAGSQVRIHQGLLRCRDDAGSEAADRGDRGGGRRILGQRFRWRARERQGGRPHYRLRQAISPWTTDLAPTTR